MASMAIVVTCIRMMKVRICLLPWGGLQRRILQTNLLVLNTCLTLLLFIRPQCPAWNSSGSRPATRHWSPRPSLRIPGSMEGREMIIDIWNSFSARITAHAWPHWAILDVSRLYLERSLNHHLPGHLKECLGSTLIFLLWPRLTLTWTVGCRKKR